MSISLATRGVLCTGGASLSLSTWGVICLQLEAALGFDAQPLPFEETCIYNKESPTLIDSEAGLFSIPRAQLTGSRVPKLTSPRPSLLDRPALALAERKKVQLTGTRVVDIVDGKRVLLSEPDEPTLTSSGTSIPDLFDKKC